MNEAIKFFQSIRGQYIISQALSIAIETMKNKPERQIEHSNIADMIYLQDELFPIYKAIAAAQKGE